MDHLAAAAGVDKGTISRLERGLIKRPSADAINRLTRALEISDADLIARSGAEPAALDILKSELEELTTRVRDLETRGGPPTQLRHDAVRLAPIRAGDADPTGAGPMVEGEQEADLFPLLVQGDCLAPVIEPGDILLMSRNRRPQIGDVVSVLVNGERLIKVVLAGAGGLVLMSNRGEVRLPAEGAELEGTMIGEPYAQKPNRQQSIRTLLRAGWQQRTPVAAGESI